MLRCFARALRPALLSIALWLYSLLHAGNAMADTMRCGTKLVATGDSPYDVRSRCGEPAFATRRVEYRTVSAFGAGIGATRTVEIVIDEWVYDFGPQHFVQHLIFEQSRLIAVVSGHRGQKKRE